MHIPRPLHRVGPLNVTSEAKFCVHLSPLFTGTPPAGEVLASWQALEERFRGRAPSSPLKTTACRRTPSGSSHRRDSSDSTSGRMIIIHIGFFFPVFRLFNGNPLKKKKITLRSGNRTFLAKEMLLIKKQILTGDARRSTYYQLPTDLLRAILRH